MLLGVHSGLFEEVVGVVASFVVYNLFGGVPCRLATRTGRFRKLLVVGLVVFGVPVRRLPQSRVCFQLLTEEDTYLVELRVNPSQPPHHVADWVHAVPEVVV